MKRHLLTVCLAVTVGCSHDDLEVATGVQLQRFEGKWYEIAHLPRPTQRDCTATIATYTHQPNGTYTFAHECTLTSGAYYGKTAIAKVPDAQSPAKLTVDFGGYVGDYWILDVAPDYRYAVVGHPSREYLWILSRTPTMTPLDHDAALSTADKKGFETKNLEYTTAGPEPSGTPAPPMTTGCGLSRAPSRVGTWAPFMISAFAVLALSRRRRGAGRA
jgi:apolipoprotein D and lipocalin family protein